MNATQSLADSAKQSVAPSIDRAARQIAPLFPLDRFVAVNPFLGQAERPFADTARTLAEVAGARLTMPRSFYAEALRAGRITDQDLADALADALADPAIADPGLPRHAAQLRRLALAADGSPWPVVPTVDAVAAAQTGTDWPHLVRDRISAWAAAFFDEGQASLRPAAGPAPYVAWRAEAVVDRTPELLGLAGFRACVRRLPEDPQEAAAQILARLAVPAPLVDRYLHRLLMTIGGWAGFARYRLWEAERHGRGDRTLHELLVIRLACELAVYEAFERDGLPAAFARALTDFLAPPPAEARVALAVDLVLHVAYERAFQRAFIAELGDGTGTHHLPSAQTPRFQAVFCIDVRSEPLRRALEAIDSAQRSAAPSIDSAEQRGAPSIDSAEQRAAPFIEPTVATLGFAGFFGVPFSYVPLGDERGVAQCPVLLAPKYVIAETTTEPAEQRSAARGRVLRRRAAHAWRAFKSGAVSCFAFVGPVGLAYARKLVGDTLGLSRPVPHPQTDGLARGLRRGPTLAADGVGRGIPAAERVTIAESVLRGMSLTDGFARLVLLAGHGSSTVNNPHAAGLDCGACGGQSGAAAARVAAALLGDPAVRAGLVERGIRVPAETVFLAGLHDTTTDEVTLFDVDRVPASHAADLAQLQAALAAAAQRCRAERAARLFPGASDAELQRRARDWSQVRPEWGLAGCAAFIAAPRACTAGRSLGGRVFLHSYEWRQDEARDFGVLALIMTAPMVVASWISLQYYGSTVDNRVFGSGDKVLHNVVGGLGVLEGHGGDLRPGLPWQSLHDGERLVHEPLRLSVFIAAPTAAMNAVIARHEQVRQLLDNGWLHLYALDDIGAVTARYRGALRWEALRPGVAAESHQQAA